MTGQIQEVSRPHRSHREFAQGYLNSEISKTSPKDQSMAFDLLCKRNTLYIYTYFILYIFIYCCGCFGGVWEPLPVVFRAYSGYCAQLSLLAGPYDALKLNLGSQPVARQTYKCLYYLGPKRVYFFIKTLQKWFQGLSACFACERSQFELQQHMDSPRTSSGTTRSDAKHRARSGP